MSERVKAYFEMLEGLSSEDLDRSARELAVREKQNGARLIAHISESAGLPPLPSRGEGGISGRRPRSGHTEESEA